MSFVEMKSSKVSQLLSENCSFSEVSRVLPLFPSSSPFSPLVSSLSSVLSAEEKGEKGDDGIQSSLSLLYENISLYIY